jgi:hypothetical protein
MSLLERRYRRILRLLPAQYRRAWEEDMVAAYLHSVSAEQDADGTDGDAGLMDTRCPSLSEIASVVVLAVQMRLRGVDTSVRSLTWGAAVQGATLMALLSLAVATACDALTSLWLSGTFGRPPGELAAWAPIPVGDTWHTAWGLTGWCWIVTYLALVWGQRRAAQVIALVAVLPTGVDLAVRTARGGTPLGTGWPFLAFCCAVILGMTAFPPGESPTHRRRWVLALPIGVVLVPLPLAIVQFLVPASRWIDTPALECAVVTVLLVLGRTAGARRWGVATKLSFVLLAAAVVALRLLTLAGFVGQAEVTFLVGAALMQVGAVLAVGLPFARSTLRAFRALPGPVAPAVPS